MENHFHWFILLDFIQRQCFQVLARVCTVNDPSPSPLPSLSCNLNGCKIFWFSWERVPYQQCDANLPQSYGLHSIFATHVAWEVSSIAGFLRGWIARRQKLISNSTEINDFALTCSLAQQRLGAFPEDERCKYLYFKSSCLLFAVCNDLITIINSDCVVLFLFPCLIFYIFVLHKSALYQVQRIKKT